MKVYLQTETEHSSQRLGCSDGKPTNKKKMCLRNMYIINLMYTLVIQNSNIKKLKCRNHFEMHSISKVLQAAQ